MYYKLDNSGRSGVEGLNNKVGAEILAYTVLFIFWCVAAAVTVINFNVLFSDTRVTVFISIFIFLLSVISALFFVKYVPVYKKRINARRILKNCTLTDGTVTSVNKQKIWHNGTHRGYSYYRIFLEYSYIGSDGALCCGKYTGNYSEIPFYVGQNLMIAFNGADNVILNKFTLSEGAEEFAAAEAEREKADFKGLTGKLIKVNLSEPIKIADYSHLSFLKTVKKRNRLKQILKDNPRFTTGRFFVKKSTYRDKNVNNKFYCYITESGIRRVEECAGIAGYNDGDELTVAYGGGYSEIISGYASKKSYNKPKK
ncbi:MAG: hypothetical protein K2L42_01425 [Clostridia bacterium]|nr:hypothetical protein [Clostridia bacterium]